MKRVGKWRPRLKQREKERTLSIESEEANWRTGSMKHSTLIYIYAPAKLPVRLLLAPLVPRNYVSSALSTGSPFVRHGYYKPSNHTNSYSYSAYGLFLLVLFSSFLCPLSTPPPCCVQNARIAGSAHIHIHQVIWRRPAAAAASFGIVIARLRIKNSEE